jgi:hypothetical protein
MLSLNYSADIKKWLGASVTASYYMRNGTVPEGEGKRLGAEFSTEFVFSPVSDLSFNVGIGAFNPAFGNYTPQEKTTWKFDLTTTFALY